MRTIRGVRVGGAILWAAAVHAGVARGQATDLIVGDIPATTNYVLAGSPKAYSLAVTLCNVGSAPASFSSSTAAHPVVSQNMYRLITVNGSTRFEQIGQAWARHMVDGALEQALCGTCTPVGDLSHLGAGCSSPASASAMGVQATLGAKSEINASTGAVTYPMVNSGSGSGSAFKRLQVAAADIPSGPLYFVSAAVVTADDAAAGNALNNESYRRVTVSFINSGLPLTVQDATQRSTPAIQAWRDHGLGANTPDPGVDLRAADVAGDGRFYIAARATDLGGGAWHYEYAVQNFNSDRAAGSFSVPLPGGAAVSNAEFHAVAYHSGEVYASTPWSVAVTGSAVTWSTEAFAANPNANALRWDTIYNFRFDCNVAPGAAGAGAATLGLFKPGGTPSVAVPTIVPGGGGPCAAADWDHSGHVEPADIAAFVNSWFTGLQSATLEGDFDGNGRVEPADVALFVTAWFTALTDGC